MATRGPLRHDLAATVLRQRGIPINRATRAQWAAAAQALTGAGYVYPHQVDALRAPRRVKMPGTVANAKDSAGQLKARRAIATRTVAAPGHG